MGLGLSEGGGDFTPYVKYSAKSGRWTNREQQGEDFVDVQLDDDKAVFVADFDNIKVGYIKMVTGEAPEKHLVSVGQPMPPRASNDHKSGFQVMVFSEANLGGLREFCSTSGLVNGEMNALYDQYEKERGANPGALPVIKFTGSQIHGKNGNYKPSFQIIQWTPRPAAFDDVETSAPAAATAEVAAITAKAPPPPPPQQPVQATANTNF